jgi:hypothetical protein
VILEDGASPSDSASPDDSASPSGSAPPSDGLPPDSAPDDSADADGTGLGISQARAVEIALRAAGGGRVTKVERETEHGRPVFGIEVISGGTEHDLDIDRADGTILRHRARDDHSGSGRGTDG